MSGVLVVAEHRGGVLSEVTLEALGAAVELAGPAGLAVSTALLADEPAALGAPLEGRSPELRLVAHPELADYEPESYLAALRPVVDELRPRLVLMGHTSQGLDLAPALAGRLGLQLATDCVGLRLEGPRLVARRRPYGGKLEETLELRPAATTVVTVQPGAFAPPPPTLATASSTTRPEAIRREHLRRFVDRLVAAASDLDVAAAEVLVSVGRGIGSADNLPLAQALADRLGGVLSCSRPVADAGWMPQSRQVGTSGKTVRPRLYVALGISGAFQHVAGMKGSETIFAVNKDPRAPIFQLAHHGIVDDVLRVLPALTDALER